MKSTLLHKNIPQISPMNWFILLWLFLVSYLVIFTKIYFLK